MADDTRTENSMRLFYYRSSMTPTFAPGDVLTISPYRNKAVRVGDVVVFHSPETGDLITHRVVDITPEGVLTCGDNLRCRIDPWMLRPEDIVGYVATVERRGRQRQVWGGAVGIAYHRIHRRRARLGQIRRHIMSRAVRAVDLGRWLAALRLWALLPVSRRPRVLAIRRPRGTELLLLWGKTVIARRTPGGHLWSIRFLYLPLVDQSFLRKASHELGQREISRRRAGGLEAKP